MSNLWDDFDSEDQETAQMIVTLVEGFGDCLFHTIQAVVSPAQGQHAHAMGLWHTLGEQIVRFTYVGGDDELDPRDM